MLPLESVGLRAAVWDSVAIRVLPRAGLSLLTPVATSEQNDVGRRAAPYSPVCLDAVPQIFRVGLAASSDLAAVYACMRFSAWAGKQTTPAESELAPYVPSASPFLWQLLGASAGVAKGRQGVLPPITEGDPVVSGAGSYSKGLFAGKALGHQSAGFAACVNFVRHRAYPDSTRAS